MNSVELRPSVHIGNRRKHRRENASSARTRCATPVVIVCHSSASNNARHKVERNARSSPPSRYVTLDREMSGPANPPDRSARHRSTARARAHPRKDGRTFPTIENKSRPRPALLR